jgi:hypothetical protein
MAFEFKKRPPRQPLSPEEVLEFIYRKKISQQKATERFKKTRTYKYLNVLNVISIIIYSELFVCFFFSNCNFQGHYIKTINKFITTEFKSEKRVYSSALVTSFSDLTYDISIQDTINFPDPNTRFIVGRDWILQKEMKLRFDSIDTYYSIRRSFPLLLVSVITGTMTFVLFGYNLNQNKYSLQVMSFINAFAIISFLLL